MVGIDTDKYTDCELCKEKRSIVKVTLKKGSIFGDSKQMNLCANCRDNLDDDIRKEEYEETPKHYKF